MKVAEPCKSASLRLHSTFFLNSLSLSGISVRVTSSPKSAATHPTIKFIQTPSIYFSHSKSPIKSLPSLKKKWSLGTLFCFVHSSYPMHMKEMFQKIFNFFDRDDPEKYFSIFDK
jgi:hypothetical protein